MIRRRDTRSGEVVAFLDQNTSFEGKMTFEGMIRVDCKFTGEILSGDLLIVGEPAVVNAQIRVDTLVIRGKVSGTVTAASKIEIDTTGKLYGNIITPILVIQEGGLFNGSCKMERGAEAAPENVAPLKEKETKGEKIIDLHHDV